MGCCGGSSANPKASTYRGPTPWSAPETRALRDFVRSRVVGGTQQIRTAISWHSYDELVMWPFGFTKTDIVAPMSSDDHAAFMALGRAFAARNGYHAQQLSDIYPVDGDATDWMYGEQHIFAFLVEMYPKGSVRMPGGFYPAAALVARETVRNREAVLPIGRSRLARVVPHVPSAAPARRVGTPSIINQSSGPSGATIWLTGTLRVEREELL